MPKNEILAFNGMIESFAVQKSKYAKSEDGGEIKVETMKIVLAVPMNQLNNERDSR